MRSNGLLREPGELLDSTEDADLLQLHSAAAAGRAAFGDRRGQRDCRPGRGAEQVVRSQPEQKSLCHDLDGFSLHAATHVAADRPDRLEHLIRCVARPPIAEDRLRLDPHYHCLFADGVFSCAPGQARAEFHAVPEPTAADVA
ncbi:MAG: hypothetical protein FJ265_23280, partial [Planctomycetes bacterium]|nr:hypothetical protein [Planctomycetota bacterium]